MGCIVSPVSCDRIIHALLRKPNQRWQNRLLQAASESTKESDVTRTRSMVEGRLGEFRNRYAESRRQND
jgi:hypothetical protein